MYRIAKYIDHQTDILQKTLDRYVSIATEKYSSIDNIPQNKGEPIENKRDIEIIEKLIKVRNYIVIPVYSKKGITHAYTVGMWYFMGIPDIVINFEEPLDDNHEFIQMIFSIIHDTLSIKLEGLLVNNKTDNISEYIDRLDYTNDIKLKTPKYKTEFELCKVKEDDYFDINCNYIIWFNSYFMRAATNMNDNEIMMYPIYEINFSKQEYNNKCALILDSLESYINDLNVVNERKNLSSIVEEGNMDDSSLTTITSSDTEEINNIKIVNKNKSTKDNKEINRISNK
jgi:hypothetical protein